MLEKIIISCIGLVGAIIGSGITLQYQIIADNRKEFKERKNECLKNRKEVIEKLDKTERIIRKIIVFIISDFSGIHKDKETESEWRCTYNSITHIYDDHNQYFWDDFITNIYNFMPKTACKGCFQILNYLMRETRTMSSNIYNFIDENDDNLFALQERFIENAHKYTAAMYAIQLLKRKFQRNIIKKYKNGSVKNYYKKNKLFIKKAIKELNSNILQGWNNGY